jgi:DNA-binding transcriptional MerR regulator
MTYSLNQFATMFHVTEYTIRYYTDIGILPCARDGRNRRVFNDESLNWMQGITCLKGCGASIDDIKEYCRLCKLPESRENLQKRYQIILRQRKRANQRLAEAQATVDYMNHKVHHYEQILAGAIPDDSNPQEWTRDNRPAMHSIDGKK